MSNTISVFAPTGFGHAWEDNPVAIITDPPEWLYEVLKASEHIGASKMRWYTEVETASLYEDAMVHAEDEKIFKVIYFLGGMAACIQANGRCIVDFFSY